MKIASYTNSTITILANNGIYYTYKCNPFLRKKVQQTLKYKSAWGLVKKLELLSKVD
jgi:hypothetical protein